MRFLHLTDIDGKHHLVNPLHIVAIHESDAGCMLYLRGHSATPITLTETVEVMADALEASELDAFEHHAPR